MVSPQNPLKSKENMATLQSRMDNAFKVAKKNKRIRVTNIEVYLGTRYTIDTINRLNRFFPDKRFVWLMGADNLKQFSKWEKWQELIETIPIAVFDRSPYSAAALTARAACVYSKKRLKKNNTQNFANHKPPVWIYLMTPRHFASSTIIRSLNK
tara:strand:+ start:3664 stop:4125 length:462 start_codon:yes stop_codon:yes gene_type:complete